MWKIKRFTGATEHSLRAEVTMVSTTKERKPWARPPISMNFQVRSTSSIESKNTNEEGGWGVCLKRGAAGVGVVTVSLLNALMGVQCRVPPVVPLRYSELRQHGAKQPNAVLTGMSDFPRLQVSFP